MSWHCLPVEGVEFSLPIYLESVRSARLKSTPPPGQSCTPDSEMVTCHSSLSGTTSEHSTVNPGPIVSTSYPAAFPVRTSAPPGPGPVCQEQKADFGMKCTVSFAKYCHLSSFWRIHPSLFAEDSPEFLGSWPQSGTMQNGVCWERPMSEPHTSENVSGYLLPTPTAHDAHKPHKSDLTARQGGRSLAASVMYPTPTCQDAKNNGSKSQQLRKTPPLNAVIGGPLNPEFVEWLMGWPIGWTDCAPLETDKFRQWLQQHSVHSTQGFSHPFEARDFSPAPPLSAANPP